MPDPDFSLQCKSPSTQLRTGLAKVISKANLSLQATFARLMLRVLHQELFLEGFYVIVHKFLYILPCSRRALTPTDALDARGAHPARIICFERGLRKRMGENE